MNTGNRNPKSKTVDKRKRPSEFPEQVRSAGISIAVGGASHARQAHWKMDLEPYSPNAVKKRKDISDGVMEGWSIESSVSSPNPITPLFQYSLTPTFGSGSAGLGMVVTQ